MMIVNEFIIQNIFDGTSCIHHVGEFSKLEDASEEIIDGRALLMHFNSTVIFSGNDSNALSQRFYIVAILPVHMFPSSCGMGLFDSIKTYTCT